MIIRWVAPDNGGSPITHYTIHIRESDAVTFSTELTECDGTDTTIRDGTECSVYVYLLKAAPFELPWGTDVHAKITAWNFYGNYGASEVGNGAIITTFPDQPINLIEYYNDRDPTTLGLVWEQAPFNGGAVIEDYRVFYRIQGCNTALTQHYRDISGCTE